MLVLVLLTPLLLLLTVLAAVCDRVGPADPLYQLGEETAPIESWSRAA